MSESKIADLGEGTINLRYQSNNILARDKVLYYGHAVAAVAATDLTSPRKPRRLIEVDYEVLPPVLDVRAGHARGCADPAGRAAHRGTGQERATRPPTSPSTARQQFGDVEKGFGEAAVVVEREFTTATVHQGYIEPQNATALFKPTAQLTIWCSTQGRLACASRWPRSWHAGLEDPGGADGDRRRLWRQDRRLSGAGGGAALAEERQSPGQDDDEPGGGSGRYRPDFGLLHPGQDGRRQGGHITAAQAYLAYEAGAYPGLAGRRGDGRHLCALSARECPDRRLRCGGQQAAHGGLSRAGRDQRRLSPAKPSSTSWPKSWASIRSNSACSTAVKEGDRRADGPIYHASASSRRWKRPGAHPHYAAPLEGPNRGRGVASGFWFNYGGKSSASASVNADGTVSLVEGSVDIGGTRTSIAMQLAETLGIPAEDVTSGRRGHRLGRLHRGHLRQPHHLRHRLGGLRAGQDA